MNLAVVQVLFVAATLMCLPVQASAQDDVDLLGLTIRNKVQIGGDLPAVVIQPEVGVKSIKILMKSDGKRATLKSGRVARGKRKALTWKQPVGTRTWVADVNVQYGHGGKSRFELTIESTVYPKIASKLSKANVNLEEQYLEVQLNQPAGRVDIQVLGDTGDIIHKGTEEFDGEDPGTPLRVPWEQPEGVGVLKINIRAWSSFGFWVGTEVTPFEIQIPHEEIVFDFGKWNITAPEVPKLEGTLILLQKKVKRFGGLIRLQFYVAGYTDTVGSKVSNRELSEKRARSIAAWFRRRGLPIPVYYQGFGEGSLAVHTPDETREARNRRAIYILSGSPPSVQAAMPRANWKRL